jgi:hypothetical protein
VTEESNANGSPPIGMSPEHSKYLERVEKVKAGSTTNFMSPKFATTAKKGQTKLKK